MIFSSRHTAKATYRFRKWTNTSYAIFNSLKKIVHIGHVSSIIRGINTIKSMNFWAFFIGGEREGSSEESDEKSSIFHEENFVREFWNMAPVVLVISSEPVAHRAIVHNYFKSIFKALLGSFLFSGHRRFFNNPSLRNI